MYMLKFILLSRPVAWLVVLLGTEFVLLSKLHFRNWCWYKSSYSETEDVFFPGFTCIYFLLNSTAGKGTQSATKDYLLSMIKGNLSISYRNRHWQLPKEYLSVPLPLETTGCTREVQGWEKLQMEKRKDIWESSLNNQKTDWFQTKTGVI